MRVVDYTIDDGRHNPDAYRLLTTILDPAEASAEELATVYSERWEIESVFDELKTHQRGPRMAMRSKSPDPVKQEIWGHFRLPQPTGSPSSPPFESPAAPWLRALSPLHTLIGRRPSGDTRYLPSFDG